MPRNKTPDHKPFLDLTLRLKRITQDRGHVTIAGRDLDTLLAHGGWFAGFMAQRKLANSLIKRRGSKPKPDHLVKAKSLQRRAQRRAIKVIKGGGLKTASDQNRGG